MIYEIEFYSKEKDDLKCIHTEIVPADNVTHCNQIANEIVQQLDNVTKFFIHDFIA